MRTAFPDRVDVIETMIAQGDRVGMIFRVTGTHQGNFLGIPATGKTFEFQEMAMFRLADGKVTESWFMADEAGLMRQLGAKMPPRKDGRTIIPPLGNAGEDPDTVIKRLQSGPLATPEDRNRLLIARSKGSVPLPKSELAPDFKQTRVGFQHLRDYGDRKGVPSQNITDAMPDRHDRIEDFIAEGENVWMRFRLAAVHSRALWPPPAGKHVDVTEIGVMRVVDGKWKQAWFRRRASAAAAARISTRSRPKATSLKHRRQETQMPSSEHEARARDGARLAYTLYDHQAPSQHVVLSIRSPWTGRSGVRSPSGWRRMPAC